MEYGAIGREAHSYGSGYGFPPEAVSPYAELEHPELIDQYYAAEGDPALGVELSLRILRQAGFAGDPTTTPLRGSDGAQVEMDGRKLSLADYVNFAARRHGYALDEILEFLVMEPGTQEYESTRAGILRRLNPTGR